MSDLLSQTSPSDLERTSHAQAHRQHLPPLSRLRRTLEGRPRPSGRAPDRPADGHPGHHGREYRAPESRDGSRASWLVRQLDDHELLPDLRQPAPLRRPRRRLARTTPDVPDRSRHLHRLLVRLGDGRHRRRPLRGSRGPGSRRRDALPGSARDHHVRVPRPPAREGARCLGSRRRRRCCDRRPRRRRPDRVHRLADDLLRQPPRRSSARDRRSEGHPGRHPEAALEGSRPSGAVLATTSLGAIVFAITQAEGAGWTSVQTNLFGLGGLAGLALFAALERRTETPLLRIDRLADRAVGGGLFRCSPQPARSSGSSS